MDTQNTSRQLRYLEEVRIPLHRAGFETLPLEGAQLPVLWNGAPLCRITGKGSVFYRREDADTPQAEDALYRVEDIAAKTLEYMTAMEAAPQLKASGLDGDYRILADFGGTVLAGTPSTRRNSATVPRRALRPPKAATTPSPAAPSSRCCPWVFPATPVRRSCWAP